MINATYGPARQLLTRLIKVRSTESQIPSPLRLTRRELETSKRLINNFRFDINKMVLDGFTAYKSPAHDLTFVINKGPIRGLTQNGFPITRWDRPVIGEPVRIHAVDLSTAREIGYVHFLIERGGVVCDRYIDDDNFSEIEMGKSLQDYSSIIGRPITEMPVPSNYLKSSALRVSKEFQGKKLGLALSALMGVFSTRYFGKHYVLRTMTKDSKPFHDNILRQGREVILIFKDYNVDLKRVNDFLKLLELIS